MPKVIIRVLRLFTGFLLYAVGIVMTINANLGLAPWDVFHQGLSLKTGITMGQVSILVGALIVALNWFLGERVGWGTLGNMLFVGIFMDVLMSNHLIPTFEGFLPSLLLMLLGVFVIGVATYFYLGAGFGSGPRDGLMVALTRKTGKSVRLIRNSIELTVLFAGYLLGGQVGLGTLVVALSIGYFVQFAFKLFNFQVNEVSHRFLEDDIIWLRSWLAQDQTGEVNRQRK